MREIQISADDLGMFKRLFSGSVDCNKADSEPAGFITLAASFINRGFALENNGGFLQLTDAGSIVGTLALDQSEQAGGKPMSFLVSR